ncbi:MAG: hypothetical protein JNL83_13200 [Myxococcales bacterium]|nr:hypothetical protein [Myxococcales bacterium]
MRGPIALVLAVTAACGGGGGGGGDDTPVSDAAALSDAITQQGLIVNVVALPALPGEIKSDLTVTSVVFHVQRLQVIGDNGQPMTSAAFDLGWQGEGTNPSPIDFPTAPSGLYSQVSIEIDASAAAPVYEIFGTVKVGGDIEMFHIRDTENLDIDITGYNVTLAPGQSAIMGVRLDLRDAIDGIDMGMLPMMMGRRTLETNDAQMSEFRDKLDDAFKRSP